MQVGLVRSFDPLWSLKEIALLGRTSFQEKNEVQKNLEVQKNTGGARAPPGGSMICVLLRPMGATADGYQYMQSYVLQWVMSIPLQNRG
jgi:hypothetical protein